MRTFRSQKAWLLSRSITWVTGFFLPLVDQPLCQGRPAKGGLPVESAAAL
jgi:hypothetical protein